MTQAPRRCDATSLLRCFIQLHGGPDTVSLLSLHTPTPPGIQPMLRFPICLQLVRPPDSSPPATRPHKERLTPSPVPLKQHVVPLGWELYTANMLIATSWSMRVLPMGGGLCCSRTWNSLRTSSATAGKVSILQTEKESVERRLRPGAQGSQSAQLTRCHVSQGRGTPPGCCLPGKGDPVGCRLPSRSCGE